MPREEKGVHDDDDDDAYRSPRKPGIVNDTLGPEQAITEGCAEGSSRTSAYYPSRMSARA